jgi:dTDP-4-dehydrorhamnose reductase
MDVILFIFETQVRTHVVNHLIIRPSYLYGYSLNVLDSRLENAKARLEAGETLHYFDDMYKSPLEVNKAAQLMAKLIELHHRGIVHVAGKRISIYEFYLESLQSLGVNTSNLKTTG